MTTTHDATFTLFADSEPMIERPRGGELKIAAPRHQKLTPSQQTFNRLSRRIEQLQRAIQRDTAGLQTLLQAYNARVPAPLRALAEGRIALAKALGDSTKAIKYGKRQAQQVRDAILILCDQAFAEVEADEPTQAFYDAWSDTSYQEELQSQQQAMKEMLSQTAKQAFGVEIDFSEMGDTPEEMAQFAKRMESRFLDGAGPAQPRPSGRKKTRKQLEKEERQLQREQQQLKSIRSLYLSLAKALHPDTETDPARKADKEALMKEVTSAYAARDLATLLKLELAWVAGESHNLAALSDEKLKLYIASLREQVEALESEHAALAYHPRFVAVGRFLGMPTSEALDEIREIAESCEELRQVLAAMTAACADPKRKREIVEFVNDYTASARMSLSDSLLDML